ncbi:MAG: 4-(cytidine 5'-diphospho)-2-C-methyl-D-erythritol kinase [Bacteroidales bacterium]|nr:4-(cytidine 5'-diphospho)-2-C-methyl-D-erythritol kinase [Bacteroidales bacterium]
MREIHPNAKINIGLNITNRRPDGFHDIETVFYPVRLADHLFIRLAENKDDEIFNVFSSIRTIGSVKDTSIHDELSKSDSNIISKALALLRENYTVPPIYIALMKRIPVGAGLGGGSADAAFFIKEINSFFSLGMTTDQMKELASRLGSDCAFFIDNTPKYATGRGEIMQSVPSVLDGYKIKVIKPLFNISTKEAYSKVKPQTPKTSLLEDYKRPVKEWKDYIKNDFEQFLFPEHPELQRYKDALYESGALYAAMTGSGSALFGIFEGDPDLNDEIRQLAV